MKKNIVFSFLLSLALHAVVWIPVLTFIPTSYIKSYNITDEHIDEHLEDIEEVIDMFLPDDGPAEKKVDKFFDYLKKAAKIFIPVAMAIGTAFKLFTTFWK